MGTQAAEWTFQIMASGPNHRNGGMFFAQNKTFLKSKTQIHTKMRIDPR